MDRFPCGGAIQDGVYRHVAPEEEAQRVEIKDLRPVPLFKKPQAQVSLETRAGIATISRRRAHPPQPTKTENKNFSHPTASD